ncbi:MAG: uroporphyrinogen-III synthase [Gemmatimonadaceae bacterium]
MSGAGTLQGRRVLVTRAAEDAAEWAAQLSAMGAEPVVLPCLITERLDDDATRAAVERAITVADWLVVSSPRGVAALAALYAAALPRRVSIAAVGPATARACRERLGRTPVVPAEHTSEGLGWHLATILGRTNTGTKRQVVFVGAADGRTDAEPALTAQGAVVTRVDLYRTIPVPVATPKRDLADDGVEDVLLASPSAAQGLVNCAVVPRTARVITIGPTTSAAAVAAGLPVSAEAARPTFQAMLDVMLQAVRCATFRS